MAGGGSDGGGGGGGCTGGVKYFETYKPIELKNQFAG